MHAKKCAMFFLFSLFWMGNFTVTASEWVTPPLTHINQEPFAIADKLPTTVDLLDRRTSNAVVANVKVTSDWRPVCNRHLYFITLEVDGVQVGMLMFLFNENEKCKINLIKKIN